MSSRDRTVSRNTREVDQEARSHRARNTQPRSNVASSGTPPTGASSRTSTTERHQRTEKSVFTFMDGRNSRTLADGPGYLIHSYWGDIVGHEALHRTEHLRRQRFPTARQRLSRATGHNLNRERGEFGESSRLNMSTIYRRNLLANQGNPRRSVSRETGRPNLIRQASSSSSSSEKNNPNPNTFFSLVELRSTKDIEQNSKHRSTLQTEKSESDYFESGKVFKETMKKLDEVPGWLPKARDSDNPLVPPVSPDIGNSESIESMRKPKKHQTAGGNDDMSKSSIIYSQQKSLDPQELMKKLKDISDNRRTYYVQKTGSDNDSLLDMLWQSPQRNSIESSVLSLPMNVARDCSPSTRALAGSMATLKYIDDLSKRKPGSTIQNNTKREEHKVLHLKKCETFIQPVDIYRKDMIINVPIDPLSPVEPHETVEAPSVDAVIMINQICEEIDNIFKDLHTGFYGSKEQIERQEVATKEQEKKQFQRTESDKQLLTELRLALLPPPPVVRRSVDSRRSVQSLGSRHSSRLSSLGELQRSLSQPSVTSLPIEPEMNTEELIKILNQKFDKGPDQGKQHSSSNESENDIKIIYSSDSAHLKRQLSKKALETVTDVDIESTQSGQRSVMLNTSSRKSSVKGSLRRFTAKVQIPTISDMSVSGESSERKGSESEKPGDGQRVESQGSTRLSMISTGTIASAKLREAEQQAIANLIEDEFGTMKLDAININPEDFDARSHYELNEALSEYADPGGNGDDNGDIFEGDPQLLEENGITQQLMLQKAQFPKESLKERRHSPKTGHDAPKHRKILPKKTKVRDIIQPKGPEKNSEGPETEEQSCEECNDWVQITSNEEVQHPESDNEEALEENTETKLVIDPKEMRLMFPFAFMLSTDSSWWKRPRNSTNYRDPITKEKIPEFDDLRDQLKALLEEYKDNYTRFETVYRWADPHDPPTWNKKYRSPCLRPNVSNNQDPNRFHLSDDALSMKDGKGRNDKQDKPPGYSTATFYVEPTKWWNLANVRRYVLRKELAKYSLDHQKLRLGLRAKPSKFSASLILGCRKRRSRQKGQVCRRKKDVNKTIVAMFMKKNLPRSMWKDLKTKYQLATSLRYRQRHHWNPFHPLNRPSIDGTARMGWNMKTLIRKNNLTFLGQFARGADDKHQAEVRTINESEVRDKWQRDIMEMAYVTYSTNKLITEELEFLVMIGFWLGLVIDEYSYFMKFILGELGQEQTRKSIYEKKQPKKVKAHIHPGLLDGTEKRNPEIWEKIMKVCDKTLFMLRRGLLPIEGEKGELKTEQETQPEDKYVGKALSIPWYENTKLRRTNQRLLDSIALAYPDFYYLAKKNNKYYHVEMDADEAKWFPIRYYDADTGEYNFISHDHPKWPDWKFLHMTSYGDAFQMKPISFAHDKEDSHGSSRTGLLSEQSLTDDNQIQEYRDSGIITAAARASHMAEKKRVLFLMLMSECFDEEGNFRYILVNPIKFDRKRVNMSYMTLAKAPTHMCADPNTVGLDDIQARFLKKSKLREKHIKLDPETFKRLLKKYAAKGESPRSFTDRRIDIALDYWYRKAAQVNRLLDAISFKVQAVERIFTFLQMHRESKQLLIFDDPNSLKFQNEPVWNRRILENFQQGCSGHKTCDKEEQLISRSSHSSSCSASSGTTEEPEGPIDRIPSDFLKVMHTYFSLTTVETLKKENFVDFPVPLETLYCYERIKKGPSSKQKNIPYDKMSLRGRISERHRVRLEKRKELNKVRDQKKIEGDEEGKGDHARCMGNEDDPRTHVGFKSRCPVCHKMLISHHPSLTLYIEFKSRHIREHRTNAEGIKPPKKTGSVKFKHPDTSDVGTAKNYNRGNNADAHEDCYLHCKVPTILSIFQGRSVNKNKQEKLIRYFNRALHYEHAAVKDEITTRLNEETDEMEFLKYKQNYMQELQDTICEKICPIISQQIQTLLTHQELLNDLYICWLDAYSRGANLLSEIEPHMRTNRVYPSDIITTNFLDTIIKVLRRPELAKVKEQSKASINAEPEAQLTPFELWFENFVKTGLLPRSTSSLDVGDEQKFENQSTVTSRFNLLDHSDQSQVKRGEGQPEDAASVFSHPDTSSEDESSDSKNSQGRLIDIRPSQSETESDVD